MQNDSVSEIFKVEMCLMLQGHEIYANWKSIYN